MNRTNFRHRTLDHAKPLTIFRDITEVVPKKDDPTFIQIPNGISERLIDREAENKEIIEQEVKKIIDLFDKKKVIIIPKSERLGLEKAQPAINENNYSSITNYAQTNFQRKDHNIIYSERNRLESLTKEYEASVYDITFLKHFNFFSVEELESIIITLENDVNIGEMIPYERAKYLLENMFQGKEQYFEKVYQYWVNRREDFKKPLLRKFWKDQQKCSDKYIGTTFRKREREKMRTRRYKKNDQEELIKLKEIKQTMETYLLNLLKCIKDRENAKRCAATLDYINFKGEMNAAKYGPNSIGIEKEWSSFLNLYSKVKNNFTSINNTKIQREISHFRDKENEERKVKLVNPVASNPSVSQPVAPIHSNKEKKLSSQHIKISNTEPKIEASKPEKKPIRTHKNKKTVTSDIGVKKGDGALGSKKEEIERIKYFIRKDRFKRYVIHRYVNNKNIYSPFDENYTKQMLKNSTYFSNSSNNSNNESNFIHYFDKFSKERYGKLYSDSDDDENPETLQKEISDISLNLKQFLKKKKDSSTRYHIPN